MSSMHISGDRPSPAQSIEQTLKDCQKVVTDCQKKFREFSPESTINNRLGVLSASLVLASEQLRTSGITHKAVHLKLKMMRDSVSIMKMSITNDQAIRERCFLDAAPTSSSSSSSDTSPTTVVRRSSTAEVWQRFSRKLSQRANARAALTERDNFMRQERFQRFSAALINKHNLEASSPSMSTPATQYRPTPSSVPETISFEEMRWQQTASSSTPAPVFVTPLPMPALHLTSISVRDSDVHAEEGKVEAHSSSHATPQVDNTTMLITREEADDYGINPETSISIRGPLAKIKEQKKWILEALSAWLTAKALSETAHANFHRAHGWCLDPSHPLVKTRDFTVREFERANEMFAHARGDLDVFLS